MTSPGKLSSALQSLNSLLRDVTALARSWTSSDGWFRGERPAGRPGRPCDVGERVSFEQEESYKRESARTPRCFKLSVFGHRPQAAGPISVRMGRSPAHVQAFWGGIYVIRHSIHSMEDTNLQILYACLVTHDANLLPLPSQQCSPLLWFKRTRDTQNLYCMDIIY